MERLLAIGMLLSIAAAGACTDTGDEGPLLKIEIFQRDVVDDPIFTVEGTGIESWDQLENEWGSWAVLGVADDQTMADLRETVFPGDFVCRVTVGNEEWWGDATSPGSALPFDGVVITVGGFAVKDGEVTDEVDWSVLYLESGGVEIDGVDLLQAARNAWEDSD